MDWFLLFYIVMGAIIGTIPRFIMKNIRTAIEMGYWERDKALGKVNTWLLVYAWAIVFTSCGFVVQVAMDANKELEKIDARIETIEKQVSLPSADTLYINSLTGQEDE